MKDQYRKETSQIHAPADLIQKTKQAMEQEEQRLKAVEERNVGSDGTVITESEAITHKAKKHSFIQQIYKWTLPLTAAAAILILISVSLVMKSVKSDSSASDMMAESEALKRITGYDGDTSIEHVFSKIKYYMRQMNQTPKYRKPKDEKKGKIDSLWKDYKDSYDISSSILSGYYSAVSNLRDGLERTMKQ